MHQLHFTSQANAFLGVFLDRLLKTVSRDEVRIVMVLVFKKKKKSIGFIEACTFWSIGFISELLFKPEHEMQAFEFFLESVCAAACTRTRKSNGRDQVTSCVHNSEGQSCRRRFVFCERARHDFSNK